MQLLDKYAMQLLGQELLTAVTVLGNLSELQSGVSGKVVMPNVISDVMRNLER